jgi:hypothetical protein
MTAPENLNDQTESLAPVPSASAPPSTQLDAAAALHELRILVLGLGVALLVVSLAFNAFVYKQNRNMAGEASARKQQAAQLRAWQQRAFPTLNALAQYSASHPELTEIFKRHGIQLTKSGTQGQQPTP